MKSSAIQASLGLILLFAFSSCRKQEDPEATVVYKVSETSGAGPAYSVTYTGDNSTQTQGPITARSWSSPTFIKKYGEHVSFTVNGGTGTGSFIMSIYLNGSLIKKDNFDNPFGPKTIEADLYW